MLRLEKKSKNRPVSVCLRVGGRLFTPTFLRALALAIGLHLSGFVIFQVSPFKIGHLETTFPPIQVNIDIGAPLDGTVLARLEGEGTTSVAMAEPKPSTPSIPLVPELTMQRDLAYPKEQATHKYPFQQMEAGLSYINLLDLSPPSPKSADRIDIQVYGDLAHKEILKTGWDDKDVLANYTKGSCLATYDVKVEDRTGKVFWYEQQQGPDKKKRNALAENILNRLQFAKDPSGCISLGRVEITFTMME
ncbi:MAG: hypothetical protein ACE5GN_00990 [Waddliaceae bacterium]